METGSVETVTSSPVVEHTSKAMWSTLKDGLLRIPIAAKNAENVAILSQQLDAPALKNVRQLLEQHGKTIAKASEVAATAMDVTLATVCAALAGEKIHALGSVQKDMSISPLLAGRTSDLYRDKTKMAAVKLGGIGGAILVVRPVSRLAFLTSTMIAPMSERIGALVNRIAGGNEPLSNPS